MNRDAAAVSKLDRLKDLAFKLNVAVLVFVVLLGIVEVVAWQLCRVLVAPHREMREPAYLEAYRGLEGVEEHLANLKSTDLPLKYQPYYLWGVGEVRTSTYNVLPDWGGIRKTINVPKPHRTRQVRIFLLGGSTVFCSRVPDQHTIASYLSARLNEGSEAIEFSVTNLGRGGFVSDQEIVLLTQILTAGEIPDLVVFYDGVNETVNKVCKGVPHYQYRRFCSVETRAHERTGLLQVALEHDYVGKLADLIAGRPPDEAHYVGDRQELLANAQKMATRYQQNVAFMRKLGEAYGFETVFLWQPNLFTTGKRRTVEETGILENDATTSAWRPGFEIADGVIKETMQEKKAFYDLSDVLDRAEGCVFFDACHVSAEANRAIADRIAEILVEAGCLKGLNES